MLDIRKYRPEIDGLRAFAVVSVIIYHTGLGILPGGYIGVDVFFVISGFLITGIIHRELSEKRFSLLTFYERRTRRIFPALFLVLGICAVAAFVIMTPGQLRNFSQSVLATSVFLSNVYFFLKTGYFDQRSEELPLLHTWSLAVEEQYYIVFPFILMAIWAVRPRLLKPVLVILFVISLAFSISIQFDRPSFNFFMLPTRGWELLTGAFLAVTFEKLRYVLSKAGPLPAVLEILGLAGITLPLFYLAHSSPFPGTNAMPVVFGTALLILAMTPHSPVGRIMASKPFVYVGLVSYSAYLIHQPLFVFARLTLENPGFMVFAALSVATLLLAWFSWRFVELPFRQKNKISRKALFTAGLSAMAIFTVLGITGHLLRGLPQRFDENTLKIAATVNTSPFRDKCHTEGKNYLKPQKACAYYKGDVKWAVLGDSHAVEFAAVLARRLEPLGIAVKHLSFSGCPPALKFSLNNPGCSQWTKQAIDFLETANTIDTVVIVYRHSFHLYGDQLASYPELPKKAPAFLPQLGATTARERYWASLEEIVKRLTAAGKKVYLMDPFPELPSHVERIIFGNSNRDADVSRQGIPVSFFVKRNAAILARLKSLSKNPGVSRLNTRQALCNDNTCLAIDKGQSLYFDDNHLSMSGARRVLNYNISKGLLALPEKRTSGN